MEIRILWIPKIEELSQGNQTDGGHHGSPKGPTCKLDVDGRVVVDVGSTSSLGGGLVRCVA